MIWLDRVKELKAEQHITNEALANMTGISLGTLNKMLAGQTESPKISVMISLANALGTDLCYLAGVSDSPVSKSVIASRFERLDKKGKARVTEALSEEERRMAAERQAAEIDTEGDEAYKIIRLYDVPVSAGLGSFLDSASFELLKFRRGTKADIADYAVKVSGDSMEPTYSHGDVVLVESRSDVSLGEIGIFLYNGESYIKKYGRDRLHSVNPKYSDIVFGSEDSIRCLGKVVAKIKRQV